jgi:site-specific DNA-methyltransferase (adenine-specific)
MGEASRFFCCARASKKDRGEGNNHPTVKPQALMQYLIRLVTTEGATVLDPFLGSGSTAVAAVELGRHYIGYELSPEYFDMACKRIGSAKGDRQTRMELR